MTPTERSQILQLLSQVLIDNNGQRLTRALVVGICAEIDNNVPPAETGAAAATETNTETATEKNDVQPA